MVRLPNHDHVAERYKIWRRICWKVNISFVDVFLVREEKVLAFLSSRLSLILVKKDYVRFMVGSVLMDVQSFEIFPIDLEFFLKIWSLSSSYSLTVEMIWSILMWGLSYLIDKEPLVIFIGLNLAQIYITVQGTNKLSLN